jgi:hypothetical protein
MLPGYTWCNSYVPEYSERLSPAWWLILAVFLVVPTSVLIFLPLSLIVGVLTGVVLWVGMVGLLWSLSPTVSLSAAGFRAGRARVEWQHVEDVIAVDADSATAEKGVNLDARAWLVLRPWIGPAVKVVLNDRTDPTPYWLVSTRRPTEVVSAWKKLTGS